MDIRAAINTTLATAPCGPVINYPWQPTIINQNSSISAAHINGIRNALLTPPMILDPANPLPPAVVPKDIISADYMNRLYGAALNATCGGGNCGNSTIEDPETCDPPNGTTCAANCQIVAGGSCGPGTSLVENRCFVDVGMDEANTYNSCMAYAATIPPASCAQPPTSCVYVSGPKLRCCYDICVPGAPSCGNGSLDAGEQCDDANTANLDGCNSSCQCEYTWTPGVCGANGCLATEKYQTGTSLSAQCAPTSRCVSDPACGGFVNCGAAYGAGFNCYCVDDSLRTRDEICQATVGPACSVTGANCMSCSAGNSPFCARPGAACPCDAPDVVTNDRTGCTACYTIPLARQASCGGSFCCETCS